MARPDLVRFRQPGDLMLFHRHIGIDYSGAETADSSLKGLRVFMAESGTEPVEVPPPPSPRKYWTRRGLAHWLAEVLDEDVPTLVGIDHGFSFPLRYFEAHGLRPDWESFLVDFQAHWPTDERATYVDFVREGVCGNGAARTGHLAAVFTPSLTPPQKTVAAVEGWILGVA